MSTPSDREETPSETRERTNCWEDLQAKIVRESSSPDHSFLSSLVVLKYLLYFKYVCRIIWSRAFYLRNVCISAYLSCLDQQLPLERFYFYLERFILIGALLFSGALLFFLQSAFLFLHSAFLILHSAPLKFPVWVSTYIFSLSCESARYLFSFQNYHAAIISISWCEALNLLIMLWGFWYFYMF